MARLAKRIESDLIFGDSREAVHSFKKLNKRMNDGWKIKRIIKKGEGATAHLRKIVRS